MNYSVKELREKLAEKISGLGINPKFKENPAYASALAEIESLISQMNMFEAAEVVSVREEEGTISFDWTSSVGDKYSMSISSSSPETFRCIRIEEKKPYVSTDGQTVREKNVIEEVATIDKSSGFITLTTNGSMVDNIDCGVGKCNNSTWAEQKYYTSNGVMRDREYKGFSRGELTEDFNRTRVDSMLYIPRQAFDFGFWHDKYETRTALTRDKLDTARIVHEDTTNGIRYNATIPLNQEHGLRDMIVLGGDPYPQNVVIPPLSKEQIEAMIQRESNPKVAEELRALAVDRENYYYNSAEDIHFISEGISESQGMSR